MDVDDNKDKETGAVPSGSCVSPSAISSHTLRQAQLGRELEELNKALAMKQELAEKMSNNDDKMAVIKIQYEVRCRDGGFRRENFQELS